MFEVPDLSGENLRKLLYRMTKFKPTPILAIPTLELLVSLMRMPHFLSKFHFEEYRFIVDLILQYTDPFRFTEVIVSLSYHVFFRFFLQLSPVVRCKISKHVIKQLFGTENSTSEDQEDVKPCCNFYNLHNSARRILVLFMAHFSYRNQTPINKNRSLLAKSLFENRPGRHFIIGDNILSITTTEDLEFKPSCKHCAANENKGDIMKVYHEKVGAFGENELIVDEKRRRYKSAAQSPAIKKPDVESNGRSRKSLDDSVIDKTDLYSHNDQYTNLVSSTAKNSPPKPCVCWCGGYVEICLRHPLGIEYWMMKDENFVSKTSICNESPSWINTILDNVDQNDRLNNNDSTTSPGHIDGHSVSNNSEPSVANTVDDPMLFAIRPPSDLSCTNSDSGPDCLVKTTQKLDCSFKTVNDQSTPDVDSATAAKRFLLKLVTHFWTLHPAVFALSSSTFSLDVDGRSSTDLRQAVMVASSVPRYRGIHYLPHNDATVRSLKLLDMIRPQEALKIGVLYVGPNQTSEREILGNMCGSSRYDKLLNGLGHVISLLDADPDYTYLGGLSTDGSDGLFTYYWSDQITQVVFHVATLMPNKPDDPEYVDKKRHIGNNHVSIVFNDSGADYKLHTISGQFTYVAVVIEPLDDKVQRVTLKAKGEISKWLALKEAVLSDENVPLLCRQMALRAELSSRVWLAYSMGCDVYMSKGMERLKQIRHIKERYCGPEFTFESAFETDWS